MAKKDSYKDPYPMGDHWVKDVGASVFPEWSDTPKDAFLAAKPSKRVTPHEKINECDH